MMPKAWSLVFTLRFDGHGNIKPMTQISIKTKPKPIPKLSILEVLGKVNPKSPITSFVDISKRFDGVFRIKTPIVNAAFISSYDLTAELCDESRFEKSLPRSLVMLRDDSVHDALFTAYTDEPNWAKARRILMPAFKGPALKDMFNPMLDIAEQLCLKWERFGADATIDVCQDMTRLTLDAIALSTMDYRFNSFYDSRVHPFVKAMIEALEYRLDISILNTFNPLKIIRHKENLKIVNKTVDDLIQKRISRLGGQRPRRQDLLDLMISKSDPLTGEPLDNDNIKYQLITFLIAGHETTSGMLAFTIYALLKNPEIMSKARAEVEGVIGNRQVRFEDLAKLEYLDCCFRESLRLWPTAPAFTLRSIKEKEVIGDRYIVNRNQDLIVLCPSLHTDPKVWDDPTAFMPERMLKENQEKIAVHAWKPFGNGKRSCIGRAFAMQEAKLSLAMILQRFELSLEDPNYKLSIKEMLTIRPDNLYIKAKPTG